MTAAGPALRPALPAWLAAAAVALVLPFLPDPFEPLAWLLCVGTGLLVASLPPKDAVPLAVATVAFGALGRLAVFELGPKSVYLRAEEAAALGLWISAGPRLFLDALADRSRASRSVRALAWLLLVMGSLLVASTARWGVRPVVTGTLYYLRFALLASVLPVAWTVSKDATTRATIGRTVLHATLALALLGLLQLGTLPDMHDLKVFFPAVNRALTDPHQNRLVSTLLDPNLLGALLVIGACLALARLLAGHRDDRGVALVQLGVLLVATLLTVSRGSQLGVLVGLGVVTVLVRPALAWLGVPVVGGLIAVAPRLSNRFVEALWSPGGVPVTFLGFDLQPEPSAFARLQSWLAAWEVVRTAPVQGVGYNNLALALAEVGDSQAVFAGTDSSLLLVLATSGVIGLGAFGGLLLSIVRDGFALRRATGNDRWLGVGTVGAVASLLVTSTFTNALLFPAILVVLWALAAVVARGGSGVPATTEATQEPGEDTGGASPGERGAAP